MDLQAEITPKLWLSVSRAYESGLYKNAILNAIHHLTDVLREKADLTDDGEKLVNQALAGSTPKLRINRLRTQSEKDEQDGFKLMIVGLYRGIRNPRSHEQIEDSKGAADAIIVFIDYVLRVTGKAKSSFILEDWCKLVFDDHFVTSKNYVDMLVSEVPPGKRFETLLRLFEMRNRDNGSNLKLICHALIPLLDTNQQEEFISVVSQELRSVSSNDGIKYVLQLLPSYLWPQLNGVAKVRIENMLIESIDSGSYREDVDICDEGVLGAWAYTFAPYFDPSHKIKLANVVLRKLEGGRDEIAYIARYFFWQLPDILPEGPLGHWTQERFIDAICQATCNFPQVATLINRLNSSSFSKFKWSTQIQTVLKEQHLEFYEELFGSDEIPF
jgi:uncharacterized protein (TIGR02391 family)